MKLKNMAKFTDHFWYNLTADEPGKAPNGATAESRGPTSSLSGFGGLGFEGIIGKDDSVGEGTTPPEEGRRGATSGESS